VKASGPVTSCQVKDIFICKCEVEESAANKSQRIVSFDSFGCIILVIKDDSTVYEIIPNNEVEG